MSPVNRWKIKLMMLRIVGAMCPFWNHAFLETYGHMYIYIYIYIMYTHEILR